MPTGLVTSWTIWGSQTERKATWGPCTVSSGGTLVQNTPTCMQVKYIRGTQNTSSFNLCKNQVRPDYFPAGARKKIIMDESLLIIFNKSFILPQIILDMVLTSCRKSLTPSRQIQKTDGSSCALGTLKVTPQRALQIWF